MRLLYRLGRQSASGVLTLSSPGQTRGEMFVLRRGALVVPAGHLGADSELARKAALARLVRPTLRDDGALVAEIDDLRRLLRKVGQNLAGEAADAPGDPGA